jgi:hypothetical protein
LVRPFLGRRDISDWRIEPDVEHPVLKARGGTGMPQARSRVMHRSFSSVVSQLFANERTKAGQPSRLSTQRFKRSVSCDCRRNKCRVVRSARPASPEIAERGVTRSVGSKSAPHPSHWSPRAAVEPHSGHVPKT